MICQPTVQLKKVLKRSFYKIYNVGFGFANVWVNLLKSFDFFGWAQTNSFLLILNKNISKSLSVLAKQSKKWFELPPFLHASKYEYDP